MNIQETFNVIVKHARRQREKAQSDIGCMLLTPCGLKCFIGILLPEGVDPDEDDSLKVMNLIKTEGLSSDENKDFLYTMRDIHDDFPVSEWDGAFARYAQVYNLNYTPQPIIEL